MRKKDETLEQTILDIAKETVGKAGPAAITIRSIAAKAGIASGTVYNYFSGKDEILLELTEDYWHSALTEMQGEIHAGTFRGQLEEIYAFLSQKIRQSAGLLLESLSDVEDAGRKSVNDMQKTVKAALVQRLEQDTAIRPGIWNDMFTKEQYADFVMMHMRILLQMQTADPSFFLK